MYICIYYSNNVIMYINNKEKTLLFYTEYTFKIKLKLKTAEEKVKTSAI